MIPAPPAQVQAAPAPRALAFEGFNGWPLEGTVVPAQGGRWFAVMVADSGPLDRDWSGPRLASHAGRALAQWLQGLGVASLRYDKRIAASRDPRLDASLDAQAGDIRAAIQAARALPEARDRRILLVGHGEGALLALFAAQDADALLLLAPPSQTMAMAIEEPVAAQLPPEREVANLAHLHAVFQAIRDRKPGPTPGPDVYPALARLGVSLMAPETLDFVRATLDLDPWAMASRFVGPLAVAWGDKDMQTWKPARIPASFQGDVLDLPQANHLFKREPRSRGELDLAKAMEGYGDDRPMADLTPLAAWIKGLK